jgi:hypothetical protein
MVLVKKLASVVSIVFSVSLLLAAAAVAARPGGGLGPGVFTFTDGRRQLYRCHRHHQGHPTERLHPAVGNHPGQQRRGTGRAVRFTA